MYVLSHTLPCFLPVKEHHCDAVHFLMAMSYRCARCALHTPMQIIMFDPMYDSYVSMAKRAGAVIKPVRLALPDFHVPLEVSLAAHVTPFPPHFPSMYVQATFAVRCKHRLLGVSVCSSDSQTNPIERVMHTAAIRSSYHNCDVSPSGCCLWCMVCGVCRS